MKNLLIAIIFAFVMPVTQATAVEVMLKMDVKMYVGRINAFGMIADSGQPFAYNPEAARFSASAPTMPMNTVMATTSAEVLQRLSDELAVVLTGTGFDPKDFWMAVSITEETGGVFQMTADTGRRYNVATMQPMQ